MWTCVPDSEVAQKLEERTKRRIEEARLQDEREKEEERLKENERLKEEAERLRQADVKQQKLTLDKIQDKVLSISAAVETRTNELNDKKCCVVA